MVTFTESGGSGGGAGGGVGGGDGAQYVDCTCGDHEVWGGGTCGFGCCGAWRL